MTEPNPAGGSDLTTSYVYTPRNQLTQATMVRDGYTQTRTFLYSGPDLVSATNPENGTVTYAYNGVHQVTSRTDAKGQVTQCAYDSYGRLLSQRYFLPLGGDLVEDTSQAVTYTYDSNPYGGDNVLGRLGVVNFGQSRYDYSYNTAGRVTQQNLQTQISFPDENWNTASYPTSLTASYGWDDEGRMTSTQSPAGTYNYSFDDMGRLGGMTDGNSNPVASATYGLTGQVSSFWMSNGTTDTRTYNSLMQMTRQTVAAPPAWYGTLTVMDMEYRYTAGQNNEQIAQSKDWVTGEELNYTYDSLQRVTGVATTGSGGWGTTYGYDGFGNLWNKTPTKGSAPPLSVSYDETTNRQYGVNYDANGNPTTVNGTGVAWDGENRLAYQDGYWGLPYWYWQGHGLPVPPAEWEYDPSGKRVQSPGANGAIRVSLYNLAGQVLYQMDCPTEQYNSGCVPVQSFQYFGSKLLETTDRLGSVRVTQDTTWPYAWEEPSYYPYGEEDNNPQPDGTIKFATYLRDGPGLDYAMNRYYSSNLGRFYTPDPGGINTADPKRPGSWNRYAYVNDDPVNRHDPTGLCGEDEDDFDDRCMDNDGSGGGGADLFDAGSSVGTAVSSTFQPICATGYSPDGKGGCDQDLSSSATAVLSTVYSNTSGLTQASTWVQAAGASVIVASTGLLAGSLLGDLPAVTTATAAVGLGGAGTPSILTGGIQSSFNFGASVQPTIVNAIDGLTRVSGSTPDQSPLSGPWLSPEPFTSSAQSISSLSLPPWNPATSVASATVTQGATIVFGTAAPMFGQSGGSFQIYATPLSCIIFTPFCR